MDKKTKNKKHFLREELIGDYKKYVETILRIMVPEDKVSEELYQKRLSICIDCENLQNGTCMVCGCLVEIRGIQKVSNCPYGYWKDFRKDSQESFLRLSCSTESMEKCN